MEHRHPDDCVDSVADCWEDTKLAERWEVFQAQVDPYGEIKASRTTKEMKKEDAIESLVLHCRLTAQNLGHHKGYIEEFENILRGYLQMTIGRDPRPAELPASMNLEQIVSGAEEAQKEVSDVELAT